MAEEAHVGGLFKWTRTTGKTNPRERLWMADFWSNVNKVVTTRYVFSKISLS